MLLRGEGKRDSQWKVIVRVLLVVGGMVLSPPSEYQVFAQTQVAHNSSSASIKQHTLDPAIRFAEKSKKALESVTDFEATFHKTEVIRKKEYPYIMRIKLREKPFSVYLKFLDPHQGREVLYVEGQNNGNLLAHETGLASIAGTFSINPYSRKALREGKYPITEIGIANMLQGVIDVWKKEKNTNGAQLNYYPNAKIESSHKNLKTMDCKVVETIQPRKQRGVEYHITRLYIDKKTNLPVRVEHFGFPRHGGKPPLLAQYTYWNVKTNVHLQDIDFDKDNPNYGF